MAPLDEALYRYVMATAVILSVIRWCSLIGGGVDTDKAGEYWILYSPKVKHSIIRKHSKLIMFAIIIFFVVMICFFICNLFTGVIVLCFFCPICNEFKV
jgi:hypothetical protein